MQKDEVELISPWINHYSAILGISNTFIIDNGSKDRHVTSSLFDYVQQGGNLIRMPGHEAFSKKGLNLTEVIKERLLDYKWVLLVDCDEFLVAISNESGVGVLPVAPSDLQQYLDRVYLSETELIRLEKSYWNVPGSTTAYPGRLFKAFVKTSIEIPVDTGMHFYNPRTKESPIDDSKIVVSKDLGLIHFHNKDFAGVLLSAFNKMRFRLASCDPDYIRGYKGNGAHLCKYFLFSESEYYNSLPKPSFDIRNAVQCSIIPYSTIQKLNKETTGIELLKELTGYRSPGTLFPQRYLAIPNSTSDEIELLIRLATDVDYLLEWGTGLTTRLFAEANQAIAIRSVLHSSQALTKLASTQWFRRLLKSPRFQLIYSSLLTAPPPERAKRHGGLPVESLIAYISAPFSGFSGSSTSTSTFGEDCLLDTSRLKVAILLNGRLRPACCAFTYLYADSFKTMSVVYRKCGLCMEKHPELLELFEPLDFAGQSVLMKTRPGKRSVAIRVLQDILSRFIHG